MTSASTLDARACTALPGLRAPGHADEVHAAAMEPPPLDFDEVYERCFDFVLRSVQRLGVAPASVDDAVQDVFVVVHRRLAEFGRRSSLKTWVFGIATNVASDYRRAARRKGEHAELGEALLDRAPGPAEVAESAEALRVLDALLESLDDDKRAVFVMAELEQMSAPEMSEALGVPVNTVYSRLRAARKAFDAAVERRRHRLGGAR